MTKYLTSASNQFEADVILSRLAEAGIQAIPQSTLGYRRDGMGTRSIYVDDADLEAAQKALKDAEGISEDELIAAEEEAARQAGQQQ